MNLYFLIFVYSIVKETKFIHLQIKYAYVVLSILSINPVTNALKSAHGEKRHSSYMR